MILNLSNGKYKTSIPVDQYSRGQTEHVLNKKSYKTTDRTILNLLKVNYLNTLDVHFGRSLIRIHKSDGDNLE